MSTAAATAMLASAETSSDDAWEPGGTLGNSLAHARPASKEVDRQVNDALGLERVSLILPKELYNKYKEQAQYQGISVEAWIIQVMKEHWTGQ
jgi:hypothetical protein